MSNLLSNLSTTNVTTSVPQISTGIYHELRLVSLEPTSNDRGQGSKWVFEITAPTASTEGHPILPGAMGAKQFLNVQFYSKTPPAEGQVPFFVQRVVALVDALLGTGNAGNPKGKPARPECFDMAAAANGVIRLADEVSSQLVGKTLLAKFKEKKDADFPGTEMSQFMFPGDVKA